ncbi:D-alanine--(R)-lactate ligase VanA-Sc [Cryptosporangium japonicum]|uniref:D-alanine--D-alanine ligase n=1 Tax=Cryptosporangium japonicum TaxID=80872 RepID=A0ABN0TYR5_9ACTN
MKVGILFGGASEEHAVSVKSAREVAKHLDPAKYEPVWVRITPEGGWRWCDGPDADDGAKAVLSPDRGDHGLLVDGRGPVRLDVVLPVLHGRFGEDGAVQGLLELSGIPYVGCDVPSSALAMDKSLAYTVARAAGIGTPEFRVLTDDEKLDGLTWPLFVKPARSGSSFGVSKIEHPDELPDAVRAARRFDSKVLVEAAVAGREVGCAVLGDDPDLIVGELDRVALSHGFFRIHQEETPETGSENATFVVPADLSDVSRALVRRTATTVYRALGCRGLARVDLFLTDAGTVVLNEVNTLPGLTSYSRYPRMMAAAGLPLPAVLDRLITLALAR